MGRKSTKSKEKKLRRKEDDAKIAASQTITDAASRVEDPLSTLQPFKKFERNGLNLMLECKHLKDLDSETINWAFELVKTNMQKMYEDCDWGWNDKNKRDEMTEDEARYLIARDLDGHPHAVVHFRFDVEEEEPVLYCYEIQLDSSVRKKGLGRFMMQILELIAHKMDMVKVMCTVFKHNEAAQNFFRKKLKYECDDSNPSVESVWEDDYCYQILSKKLPKKKQAKSEETVSS